MSTPRNRRLARIFKEMAAMSEYLGGTENMFRARVYEKAAQIISSLPVDIEEYMKDHDLTKLHGIGKRTVEKIKEFIETGTIKKYEELKQQVPPDFIELMEVPGLGPKTLKTLHDAFGITTKEELIEVLKSGKAAQLKGFGPKKIEKILHGIELLQQSRERILYWKALQIARVLMAELKEAVGDRILSMEVAGSVRRGKETIGDIDILVSADRKHHHEIIEAFTKLPSVKEVILAGTTKASIISDEEDRQVDLRVIVPDEWGAALQYFTGSKEHNVRVREIAREKGLKINEYGVFRIDTNEKIAGKTEEEVYEAIGMQWIPPEMRENRGEVELAIQRKIPTLVSLEDVKGDMQSHSEWSDGSLPIIKIADFLMKNFKYEYFVLTDHSQAVRVANGLTPERFLKQIEEIKKINAELGTDFVKAGAEVDILPDGTLDLPDEILEKLDFVVASIHSHFNRDNTDRIIRACMNPYVHVIGHPTGRIIGQRDPYPLNFPQIIETCLKTGTALEINGQPDRMDLSDTLAFEARQAGVMLTLATDAHYNSNFYYMEIAVKIARRAWCTPDNILNTRPWEEIEEWKERKLKLTKM